MEFAILGDIHSSKVDLENVLRHISTIAPEAELIGTGDLYECKISKKDITDRKFSRLQEVMMIPEGFPELLTFPSVKGNQEERILLVSETDEPLREMLTQLPEVLEIGKGEVIHGHQWKWGGNPWTLIHAAVTKPLVFYGHSHQSELRIDGVPRKIEFETEYAIHECEVLVNVGAVIENREWVLYDSTKGTVTFFKA